MNPKLQQTQPIQTPSGHRILKKILAISAIVVSGLLFLVFVLVLIAFVTSPHIDGKFTANNCTQHYGSQLNNIQAPPTCDGTFYPTDAKYQQQEVTANSDGDVMAGDTVGAFVVTSGASSVPDTTSTYIAGKNTFVASQYYLSTSYVLIIISLAVLLFSIAYLAKSKWQRSTKNKKPV